MRKIVVFMMITLDGVMQAPGGPKEDTSGGFKYGGQLHIPTTSLERFCKKSCKPRIIFWAEKHLTFGPLTGHNTATFGPASMKARNMSSQKT